MELISIGWNPRFDINFADYKENGMIPARISLETRSSYRIICSEGEMPAVLTGKILHESTDKGDLPVVGDWVAAVVLDESPKRAVIHAILPRTSVFMRKEPGGRISRQPVAANIDTVFVTVGLDGNFNLRRIERYLTLSWESGAMPVILLTKADLCEDVEDKIRAAEDIAPGVAVHAISTLVGLGMEQLDVYLIPGRTVALLGSSGVGKSTIINYLLGEDAQKVNDVRDADSRGRHTTTNRQLFLTPSGAMLIDTPGMRELQLWNASDGLGETFRDIEEYAAGCRFADCRHESEPGCAVIEALNCGEIDPSRMENYRKMRKELDHLEQKQDKSAAQVERAKWKSIHKAARNFTKR